MRSSLILFCIAALIFSIVLTGCSINKTQKTAVIGSTAGGSIGAMIGKRAGNTAVGATLGTVIGASTGAFLGRRLDNISGKGDKSTAPLYVINGVSLHGKDVKNILSKISENKIESVVVLKTEEAIALYGDKGRNGAVLISIKNI